MAVYRRCLTIWVFLVLLCPVVSAGQTTQSPETAMLWQPGDPGERLFLRGRVVGDDGQPIPGAALYLRQADGTGVYQPRYQARLETAADGSFNIATVLPGQYRGAKHIHMAVTHGAYPTLETRVVFKGDANLNQVRPYDLVIVLEEVHKDGDNTVLVGDLELVMGTRGGD